MATAAKKQPKPKPNPPTPKGPTYKLFKTRDDALHVHLLVDYADVDTEDEEDDGPITVSVHDTETGDEITLAIDLAGIDEVIDLLSQAKEVLRALALGAHVPSDEREEYAVPPTEGDGEEEEEEEDDEEEEEEVEE